MFHFYTTWKIKNKGFLRFPGGIEMEPWGKKWVKNNEEKKNSIKSILMAATSISRSKTFPSEIILK